MCLRRMGITASTRLLQKLIGLMVMEVEARGVRLNMLRMLYQSFIQPTHLAKTGVSGKAVGSSQ